MYIDRKGPGGYAIEEGEGVEEGGGDTGEGRDPWVQDLRL